MNFNLKSIRRVPINRNSLFYDEDELSVDSTLGKDYVEQDMGQTVVLYQVDAQNTQVDAVYGETGTGEVRYKAPIEIPCVYEIEDPELKAYDKSKNLGTYMKTGKLKCGVYTKTLQELGVEIKKGDYLGVQVTREHAEYFVVNSINNGYSNSQAFFGVRPIWILIEAYVVDSSEFAG